MSRTVCWFSCGAASAVATKLTLAQSPDAVVAYCHVVEEHSDNMRFLSDCVRWFGKEILVLQNKKFGGSIYEVFGKTRFLVGPGGARCTLELKKDVRRLFQRHDDIQVFGYTAEEQGRLDDFIDANNGVDIRAPLIERGLIKTDCIEMIARAGIEIPAMYKLGYSNNNCIGCVKGGAGYWNKIRVDFPEVFQRMSDMEQHLGRQVVQETIGGKRQRVFLKDLSPTAGRFDQDQPGQCGFSCEAAEREFSPAADPATSR